MPPTDLDPDSAAFAASLRRLRKETGLNKGDFARLAGTDIGCITKIENEAGGFTMRTAHGIAAALGTTVAKMLVPAEVLHA